MNMLTGQTWLWFAKHGIRWKGYRVESGANSSDAPSRDCLKLVQKYAMIEVPLVIPEWVQDFWTEPGSVTASVR